MPIDKKVLEWKEYTKKEQAYRMFISDLLHANPEKAYTFLELCSEVYGKVGKENVKRDHIFEGNMRAALQDPEIGMIFHEGETYYTLKEQGGFIK